MDANITFFGLIQNTIAVGAVAFLLGLAFQTYVVVVYNKPWTWGELTFLLILSRVVAIGLTLFIWQNWPTGVMMQKGLVFFPAFIAEIIASPLALKIFKQNIFGKPTKYV